MNVRPQTPRDYAAIATLHARAFGERAAEALIVALLRHRAAFDPELSLIADEGGRVVGHALFSPQAIRLLGETVAVVNLAPIAVDPAYQGRVWAAVRPVRRASVCSQAVMAASRSTVVQFP
jgi:predicted N-acetyltransferase YhbS